MTNKQYDGHEMDITVPVPANTITLTMTARFLDNDGQVQTQTAEFDHSDIIDMRNDFLNVLNGTEKYELTNKGREHQKLLDAPNDNHNNLENYWANEWL